MKVIRFVDDQIGGGDSQSVRQPAHGGNFYRLEKITQVVGVVRIGQVRPKAEDVLESAHSGAVSIMNAVIVAAAFGARRQSNQADGTVAIPSSRC